MIDETLYSQTKLSSVIEVTANQVIGVILSIAATYYFFPHIGHVFTIGDSIITTAVFTVLSIVRQYGLRRMFNTLNVRRYNRMQANSKDIG